MSNKKDNKEKYRPAEPVAEESDPHSQHKTARHSRKSILKMSSSADAGTSEDPTKRKSFKSAKWDESNIEATLHPADKDYGHMKIDEAKTPFRRSGSLDDMGGALDSEEVARRLLSAADTLPKVMQPTSSEDHDDDSDSERREFERKRKEHYNEYYAMQKAKELLAKEQEDDDANSVQETDDQKELPSNFRKSSRCKQSKGCRLPTLSTDKSQDDSDDLSE